jgi:hypothetical protein
MDRWWVPALTIGYEHTFVHAAADFLKGVEAGTPARAHLPHRAFDPKGLRRDPPVGQVGAVGETDVAA